jgi:hypothetical protein
MRRCKCVTKQDLEALRQFEAESLRMFHHALADEYLEKLDPELRLPVMLATRDDSQWVPCMLLVLIAPKDGHPKPSEEPAYSTP